MLLDLIYEVLQFLADEAELRDVWHVEMELCAELLSNRMISGWELGWEGG